MSDVLWRQREIANGAGGDVRLAMETVTEIMKLREALMMCAPSFQGGHSKTGDAICDALGLTFPVRMPELEAKAKGWKMNPDVLWPWLKPMRNPSTSIKTSGD